MAANFEITCPCCEATIVVDRLSGEVLLHRQRVAPVSGGSIESMVSQLEAKKTEAARKFQKEIDSQKDRARILEEKFREALERADKSDTPHTNPFDYD